MREVEYDREQDLIYIDDKVITPAAFMLVYPHVFTEAYDRSRAFGFPRVPNENVIFNDIYFLIKLQELFPDMITINPADNVRR